MVKQTKLKLYPVKSGRIDGRESTLPQIYDFSQDATAPQSNRPDPWAERGWPRGAWGRREQRDPPYTMRPNRSPNPVSRDHLGSEAPNPNSSLEGWDRCQRGRAWWFLAVRTRPRLPGASLVCGLGSSLDQTTTSHTENLRTSSSY